MSKSKLLFATEKRDGMLYITALPSWHQCYRFYGLAIRLGRYLRRLLFWLE